MRVAQGTTVTDIAPGGIAYFGLTTYPNVPLYVNAKTVANGPFTAVFKKASGSLITHAYGVSAYMASPVELVKGDWVQVQFGGTGDGYPATIYTTDPGCPDGNC